jgi:hypothetical protein
VASPLPTFPSSVLDGQIIKIPINADGSAGKAQVYSRGHTWFDGLEIDDEGYVYGSTPGANQIVVIPPKGYPSGKKLDSEDALMA